MVMFFPESSWKWILFPGLNFATHLLNLSSQETNIFAYCVKSHTKNWKNQSKNSLQTILTNYYQRPQSKQYLITVIRAFQTFLKKLLSYKIFQIILTNYFQTLLGTTIWEFIPSDSYTNFYQRTLETTLTNFLSKNHFKQYISTKSFQKTHYKLLAEKSLQTILPIIRKWFQIIYVYTYIYMIMIHM